MYECTICTYKTSHSLTHHTHTNTLGNTGDLDNSLGTSGSDTRDSDYHSDTDLPKGMFASFVHMMYDAFSLFSFTTSKGSMSSSLQSGEDGNAAHNTHTTHTHSVGAGSTLDSARRLFTHRTNYDQIKAPLMGVEVGFSEAQTLAQEVDNINTLGTVKLLNFAYLSLENKGMHSFVLCSVFHSRSFWPAVGVFDGRKNVTSVCSAPHILRLLLLQSPTTLLCCIDSYPHLHIYS